MFLCTIGCITNIYLQPSFANHHSPILSMVMFPALMQTELLAFVRLAAHLVSLSTAVQLQYVLMMEMVMP